jgi:hypothetical protein
MMLATGVRISALEPGELVITEFMADTSHSDGDLEWFEVFSRATRQVDLSGWSVGDEGTVRGVIADGAGLEPGGYAVFTPDPGRFLSEWPGVTADRVFSWTGGFALANTSDEVFLIDPQDQVMAGVRYDDGDPGDADVTVYRKYTDGALDGSDFADWRESQGASVWSSADPSVSGAGAGNEADPLAFASVTGAIGSPGAGGYAAPIPEPATSLLWLIGCLTFFLARKKRPQGVDDSILT